MGAKRIKPTAAVVAGLGLVYLALAPRGAAWPYAFYLLVGLALLTHGYREWEYLAGAANPFCANGPLFVVNNLKLLGLAASGILGAPLALAARACSSTFSTSISFSASRPVS